LRAVLKAMATACFFSRPECTNSDILLEMAFFDLPLDNGMTIPLICKVCEKVFCVPPYRRKTAKCCSRSCLWHFTNPIREPKRLAKVTGRRPSNFGQYEMQCKNCKKSFGISPSRIGKKFFCSKNCYSSFERKEQKPNRYIRITVKGHRYLEHRFLMEQKLKRQLSTTEHVHHLNGDPKDNRMENLFVVDSV
jgi:hypothetical protein